MTSAPSIKIISSETCPFAEQIKIVLEEKGANYDSLLFDEYQAEENLSASLGAPVYSLDKNSLVFFVNKQRFFHPTAIMELIDEMIPDPPMLPDSLFEKATSRSWIAFCRDEFMPSFQILLRSTKIYELERARSQLLISLQKMEARLNLRESGDFFEGETFGLIDACFAPVWSRWGIIMMRFPQQNWFQKTPLLKKYRASIRAHSSVRRGRAFDLVENLMIELAQNGESIAPKLSAPKTRAALMPEGQKDRWRQALLAEGGRIAGKLAKVLAGLDIRLSEITVYGPPNPPGMRPEERLRASLDAINKRRKALEDDDPSFTTEGVEHLLF